MYDLKKPKLGEKFYLEGNESQVSDLQLLTSWMVWMVF